MLGRELGNYVVDRLLGEGGMGAVYAANHRFLGTRAAIKVLHGSYANNPAVAQRFFQEAKSSLEIGHVNIIKILDFGQSPEGELYLVMELLDGETLGQLLARVGSLSEARVAEIGCAVAEGLAAAHDKGVVHRDLKPDNVFLPSSGVPKVLDFGIAKLTSSGGGTKTGSLLGTPQYMAPEQAKGAKHVGPHTDIYALGILLFEMITGQRPFTGDEVAELLTKQLFEEPPRPSALATMSLELEALILECLAKEPSARPATMHAVSERLRRSLGAPVVDRPRAAGQPSPRPTTTLGGAAAERRPKPAGSRGSFASIAIGVSMVIGVGAMWIARDRPGGQGGRASVPPVIVAPTLAPSRERGVLKVVLRSEPPGATVFVDGRPTGITPAVLTVALPQEVELRLVGHQSLREVLTEAGERTLRLAPDAPTPAPHPSHSTRHRTGASTPVGVRSNGLD